MEQPEVFNILTQKKHPFLHIIYWLTSAGLLFFLFSNRDYDMNIRLILVSLLILVAYFVTRGINHYLIPKFLFKGKILLFLYFSLALFIFTFWLISFSVILILTYSAFNLPQLIISEREEIIILIAVN